MALGAGGKALGEGVRVKMRNRIKPYSFHRRQGNKRDIQTNQLPFDRSKYNSLACVCMCERACVCMSVPWANACGQVVLCTLKHPAAHRAPRCHCAAQKLHDWCDKRGDIDPLRRALLSALRCVCRGKWSDPFEQTATKLCLFLRGKKKTQKNHSNI